MMVRKIIHNGQLLALIITKNYSEPGIHFFTPDDFSQQVAYINHRAGKVLDSHTHNPVRREVQNTQEVLFIKRGKLRVDIYDTERNYLESHILEEGDVILFATGGHGFKVLEEVEMIEIKQGPYAGDADKTRFDGISAEHIKVK